MKHITRHLFKAKALIFALTLVSLIPISGFAKQIKLDPYFDLKTWSPPEWNQIEAIGYDETTFRIPEGLKEDVDFWIAIYTKYTTQQGVFHIAGDTHKILGEFDLTAVYANPKWSPIRRELEGKRLIERQKKLLARQLNINVKNIRLQMGLKDRMLEAIKLSGLYMPMIEKNFQKEKIPIELSRVIFVESSFNLFARSKVGASGLWQVMPNISKKFNYVSEAQDLRDHPLYATKLAAKIFKQNYQILKSWPLAITSYNFGVGSMSKLIKKYKSNDIAYLIDHVKNKKDFGFASKNFYATYLAALTVESKSNLYFPEPIYKFPEMQVSYLKTTKKLAYADLLNQFDNDKNKLIIYNPHLKDQYLKVGKTLPAGTIINTPTPNKERIAEATEEGL